MTYIRHHATRVMIRLIDRLENYIAKVEAATLDRALNSMTVADLQRWGRERGIAFEFTVEPDEVEIQVASEVLEVIEEVQRWAEGGALTRNTRPPCTCGVDGGGPNAGMAHLPNCPRYSTTTTPATTSTPPTITWSYNDHGDSARGTWVQMKSRPEYSMFRFA